MRILAGKYKGLNLETPKKSEQLLQIRPTLSRVRESIFDLVGCVSGLTVADFFCGTGSLGIEAISRGAKRCLFVDTEKQALEVLQRNLQKTTSANDCLVAKAFLPKGYRDDWPICDLVFCDPPYCFENYSKLLDYFKYKHVLKPGGRLVLQLAKSFSLPRTCDSLAVQKDRTYGKTRIMIFEKKVENC